MRKTLFIALLSLLVICSCSKSGSSSSCEKTVAGIAGTYKIVKIELGTSGTFIDITSSALSACEADDRFQLKADKTVVYTDAGTVCSPAGDDTGTWDVVGNTLTLSAGSVDLTGATIDSYDCSKLVASFTDNSTGTTLTYRITIQKI
jgi:hypothetical protein